MISKREKSALFGFLANAYTILVASLMPFIVRTVLVRYIGIEYVGVHSLFSSVLQVLNVADFGLVTALAYYLYKPVTENDRGKINTYMCFFRKVFFLVGSIILAGGLLVMPFLPFLVKGREYPAGINIYIIFLVYILQSALYYFSNLHLGTLLSANLKAYINYIVTGTALLIMYISQILIIVFLRDYYFFTFALLITVLLQALFYYLSEKRLFPWLTYKGSVSPEFRKDFRKRVFAMIISKIRNVSRNSLDCVIISAFLGLTVLAKYQNYYQVMLVPLMITQMLRNAVQPSLGNGIAEKEPDSNYGILRQYIFINCFISTVCMTCLLLLIQPFMKLWMGEKYLLGNDIVVCVAVYYYILSISEALIMLREATGIWWEGRWVAVVESILNLILNIVFVQVLGLYGIILATILTVAIINIPLEGYYVIKGYFNDKYGDYMKNILIYLFKALIAAGISYFLCMRIYVVNYGTMVIRIFASVLVPTALFLLLNIKNKECKSALIFFLRVMHNFRGQ